MKHLKARTAYLAIADGVIDASAGPAAAPHVGVFDPRWLDVTMCAHKYLGDATTSEIIDRKKVHVATLSSTVVTGRDIAACLKDGFLDVEGLNKKCQRLSNSCGLQTVLSGRGQETYAIIRDNFQRLAAPSWESRTRETRGVARPQRIDHYNFGLDNGGDNQGCVKRLLQACVGTITVTLSVIWCFFTSVT